MSHPDDRQDFEAARVTQSLALGQDRTLHDRSSGLFEALNDYDYSYLWSWMGVPIIQTPTDIMATQEVIWATRPDVIIETGVARGGSVLFMASLLEAIGKGKVIGVDIDIRAHNRDTIERHPMSKRVVLIEGGSVDEDTLDRVRAEIPAGATVMVVLDSDHSRDHVLAECRAYGPLVTPGCYLVVADTIVAHLPETSKARNRSRNLEPRNDPAEAARIYLEETPAFEVDPILNGKLILSSSPGGYLRRKQA
ncbi:MAG: class I SAM-dependent methyltransferase [Rhodobacteraceae bacterium]|nr:class I SAM-dependent methyltransferase [Paracoccaceae bacterium]